MTWQPSTPSPAQREPRPVAASLGRVSERLGLGRPTTLGAVFARWEELVGPDVAAHATPRTLRDGVLTVVVDHPAWASSLRLLAADVLGRVSEAGGEPVGELVVRVAGERPRRGR
ncbi:DUF721 domain-containing protein [Acidimicrobiaceae bacterium USS-CC1]|uniref:DUF721 domain-containing protein n=1 Tax=Acidiferrimicrobium australe TaxID=2664430 RepID=A0ABW9QSI0_9ACTN|nr:DUF721 domain-containing protein [Acidiferrimicrobium australe]